MRRRRGRQDMVLGVQITHIIPRMSNLIKSYPITWTEDAAEHAMNEIEA